MVKQSQTLRMYTTNSKVSADATGGCNSGFSIELKLLLISTAQNIMNLDSTINKKRERDMDSRAESKAKRQGRRCSDTTGGRRHRVTAALGVHQMALGCPPASRARLRTPQLQQASTRAAVVAVWALHQTTAHPCCLYLRAERGTHL
jgi:hypothetical protein